VLVLIASVVTHLSDHLYKTKYRKQILFNHLQDSQNNHNLHNHNHQIFLLLLHMHLNHRQFVMNVRFKGKKDILLWIHLILCVDVNKSFQECSLNVSAVNHNFTDHLNVHQKIVHCSTIRIK
jgi:hypothetical protein